MSSLHENYSVWEEALDRQREELERIEHAHNVRVSELCSSVKQLRAENEALSDLAQRQASELLEAERLVREMKQALVEVDVSRLAAESEAEIRSRLRCDRAVQCTIDGISQLSSPVGFNSGNSPLRGSITSNSLFSNFAQQELSRGVKYPTTTSLTQTDPVVILYEDAVSKEADRIPRLDLAGGVSSSQTSVHSGYETLRANSDCVLISHRSGGALTDRTHFTNATFRRRDSAEPTFAPLREFSYENGSNRLSRSPPTQWLVNEHYSPHCEDQRIQVDEEELEFSNELAETPSLRLRESCRLSPRGKNMVAGGHAFGQVQNAFTTSEFGESMFTTLFIRAGRRGLQLAEQVCDLWSSVKCELDQDGHFAALFVTGMLASFMFSR